MVYLLRPIARLVTFLLLIALALIGLVVAIFSLGAPDSPLGYGKLAEYTQASSASDEVGSWLQGIDGPSSFPQATALFALAAILIGLLLLYGALARTPDRLVTLEEGDGGLLAARPRALAQVADAMMGRPRGVTDRRVRLKPSRGGGTLNVRATHARSVDPGTVQSELSTAVAPLTEAFGIKTRVQPKAADSGKRVA